MKEKGLQKFFCYFVMMICLASLFACGGNSFLHDNSDHPAGAADGNMPAQSDSNAVYFSSTVDFSFITFPASDSKPLPQEDFILWASDVNVTLHNVAMPYIKFRLVGSVSPDEVKNFELFLEGISIAQQPKVDDQGYVVFDLKSQPALWQTGTRRLEVLADIIGGAKKTIGLVLESENDIVLLDTVYQKPVKPRVAPSDKFSPRTSTLQTISNGYLIFRRTSDSPQGDIVLGALNNSLAKFECEAIGMPQSIGGFRVILQSSDNDVRQLRDGEVFIAGEPVENKADIQNRDNNGTEFSSGGLIVQPGCPVSIEIRADNYDNDGVNNLSTYDTIKLFVQPLDVSGDESIEMPEVEGNELRLNTGVIMLAKNTAMSDQMMATPQDSRKIAEWGLLGKVEDSDIINFNIDWQVTGDFNVSEQVFDVYLQYGEKTTVIKSTVNATGNKWVVRGVLPRDNILPISLYAKFPFCAAEATITPILQVTAVGKISDNLLVSQSISGQTLTLTQGSLNAQIVGNRLDRVVCGGTIIDGSEYELRAVASLFNLGEIVIEVPPGSQDVIRAVYLYSGDTCLTPTGIGMTGNIADIMLHTDLLIPANRWKNIKLKYELSDIYSSSMSGLDISPKLKLIRARDQAGVMKEVNCDLSGPHIFVYRTYPIIERKSLPDYRIHNNASQPIYEFSMAPALDAFSWKQIMFNLVWTNEKALNQEQLHLELCDFRFYRNGQDITDLVSICNTKGVSVKHGGPGKITEADTMRGLIISFYDGEIVSSSYIYSIQATPRNFDSNDIGPDQVGIIFEIDPVHNGANKYLTRGEDGIWRLKRSDAESSATRYHFIWSDRSDIDESGDWHNGMLIRSLPLDPVILMAE